MKTIGKIVLVGIIAVIFSVLSIRIQTGTDTSESETIGIQKKYGFPISFQTTAPGLAWAQYDPTRFGLNTLTWITLLGLIAFGMKRMKKTGSNNGLLRTGDPRTARQSAEP
jgi:hypothetical protein